MSMILTNITDSKITDIQPMLKIADCLGKKKGKEQTYRQRDRQTERQTDRQIDNL